MREDILTIIDPTTRSSRRRRRNDSRRKQTRLVEVLEDLRPEMVDNPIEFFRKTSSSFPKSFNLNFVSGDEVNEKRTKGSGRTERRVIRRSVREFRSLEEKKGKSETHLKTSIAASPNLRALIAPKGRPTKT